MFEILSRFLLSLKDVCFPITCCNCKEIVDSEGLCSECWKKIKWIGDPKCKVCGAPFEIDIDAICLTCAKKKPYFDKAVSAFEYDDFSKGMILKFKHGDATRVCRQLAAWTYRSAEEAIKNADIIVPVPIRPFKMVKTQIQPIRIVGSRIEQA